MMKLILISGLRGKVGIELAKTFKADGFEVKPLLHDSMYSRYFIPNPSDLCDYNSVFIVHCGQPNAPRSRLERKRYLLATRNLIEESKTREIKFVFISSLSAHEGNRSNYSKDKLTLEKMTVSNSGTVIKLGIVTGIIGSYSFKILKIQKLLSYFCLDFLIAPASMFFTPVDSLSSVSKFLQNRSSWGGVYSIFNEGTQTQTKQDVFKETTRQAVVCLLFFLSKLGSGKADAFLSLIDGMRATEKLQQ